MARSGSAAVLLAAGLTAAASDAAAPDATGRWLTQDRDGVIAIAPCGSALCGRIVGIRRGADEPVPPDSRGRSQCGLTILHDEAAQPDGSWSGTVTDPRDGRTYGAQLWLDGEGRLHIRGYLGIPLLGQTQIWTRYPGGVTDDCRMG